MGAEEIARMNATLMQLDRLARSSSRLRATRPGIRGGRSWRCGRRRYQTIWRNWSSRRRGRRRRMGAWRRSRGGGPLGDCCRPGRSLRRCRGRWARRWRRPAHCVTRWSACSRASRNWIRQVRIRRRPPRTSWSRRGAGRWRRRIGLKAALAFVGAGRAEELAKQLAGCGADDVVALVEQKLKGLLPGLAAAIRNNDRGAIDRGLAEVRTVSEQAHPSLREAQARLFERDPMLAARWFAHTASAGAGAAGAGFSDGAEIPGEGGGRDCAARLKGNCSNCNERG